MYFRFSLFLFKMRLVRKEIHKKMSNKRKSPIKILVYDSKKYTEESFESHPHPGIEFKYFEGKLNKSTVQLAKPYDTVVVFVNDILSKDVLDQLVKQGKKAIFLRCSGFNNVDLEYAHQNNLKIYRVPMYSPYAIAEHAFALLLTNIRRIHKAYNRTRDFNFSLEGLTGMDLHNKTIGVIGTGKIGRVFIDIASGFKMNIIAYDPYPIENPTNFQYVSLEDLFKQSDIISLHCPFTKETKHIINDESISLMKKGVVIINTSRGGLIDSSSLLDGIKSRKISAACLDVYEEEAEYFYEDKSNHILDDEILRDLISMPNVIVTSHQAFLTKEALEQITRTVIDSITAFYDCNPLKENEI